MRPGLFYPPRIMGTVGPWGRRWGEVLKIPTPEGLRALEEELEGLAGRLDPSNHRPQVEATMAVARSFREALVASSSRRSPDSAGQGEVLVHHLEIVEAEVWRLAQSTGVAPSDAGAQALGRALEAFKAQMEAQTSGPERFHPLHMVYQLLLSYHLSRLAAALEGRAQ